MRVGYGVVKGLSEPCWVSATNFPRLSIIASPNYVVAWVAVLSFQWFAPSKLVVTFEREGPGAFTDEEVSGLVVRNKNGRVAKLNLPQKSVLIANHQVRYVQHSCSSVGSQKDMYMYTDLRRLDVRLVLDLLRRYAQRCIHSTEEESQMGPHPWLVCRFLDTSLGWTCL